MLNGLNYTSPAILSIYRQLKLIVQRIEINATFPDKKRMALSLIAMLNYSSEIINMVDDTGWRIEISAENR